MHTKVKLAAIYEKGLWTESEPNLREHVYGLEWVEKIEPTAKSETKLRKKYFPRPSTLEKRKTRNRRTLIRPICITRDLSKPTNDCLWTFYESWLISFVFSGRIGPSLTPNHQSLSKDQTYNTIDWQTLFTWPWRWHLLRLLKRHQSPTTVRFRTTLCTSSTNSLIITVKSPLSAATSRAFSVAKNSCTPCVPIFHVE